MSAQDWAAVVLIALAAALMLAYRWACRRSPPADLIDRAGKPPAGRNPKGED